MDLKFYFRRLADDADRKRVGNPRAKLVTLDPEKDDLKQAVVIEARCADEAQEDVITLHTRREEVDVKLARALRMAELYDHFVPLIREAQSIGFYHPSVWENGKAVRPKNGTRVYYATPEAPFQKARGIVVTDEDVTPEDKQTGIAA